MPVGRRHLARAEVEAAVGPRQPVARAPRAPVAQGSSARHRPRPAQPIPTSLAPGQLWQHGHLVQCTWIPVGRRRWRCCAVRRHGHVRVRWRVHQLRGAWWRCRRQCQFGQCRASRWHVSRCSLRACWRCCRSQPRRVHEPNRPLHHRRRRGRRRRCQDHERRCWPGLERMAVVEVAAVPARPSMAGPGGAGGAGFAIIVSY